MKKPIKPHDRYVRHSLADLDLARDLFGVILVDELQGTINLTALSTAKETYVGEDLGEVITDLLFTAPFHERDSYISLLVEHKSEGTLRADEHILPFQLAIQEIKIMDHGHRNHPNHLYPYVHLIGLYHGKKPYNGPLSVAPKMDIEPKWRPLRWSEKITLVDVSSFKDEDLLRYGKLGIFLTVLKYIYDPNILDILENLFPLIHEVEGLKNGVKFLYTTFEYLYRASRIEKKEDLDQIALKSLSKETGGLVMMTLGERIEKEAEKKTWEKAEKEFIIRGKRIQEEARKEARKNMIRLREQIALSLLDEGLEIATVVRCSELSSAAVERLSEKRQT